MTKTISRRLAQSAEDILEDAAHSLKGAADRFSEEAGEAISAGAVGLGHAAEELVEDAAGCSRTIAARAWEKIERHPAMLAAIAGAAVALIGLGLARRPRRA